MAGALERVAADVRKPGKRAARACDTASG